MMMRFSTIALSALKVHTTGMQADVERLCVYVWFCYSCGLVAYVSRDQFHIALPSEITCIILLLPKYSRGSYYHGANPKEAGVGRVLACVLRWVVRDNPNLDEGKRFLQNRLFCCGDDLRMRFIWLDFGPLSGGRGPLFGIRFPQQSLKILSPYNPIPLLSFRWPDDLASVTVGVLRLSGFFVFRDSIFFRERRIIEFFGPCALLTHSNTGISESSQ
jgi:hypothetical protein